MTPRASKVWGYQGHVVMTLPRNGDVARLPGFDWSNPKGRRDLST
jgi:hypothetical protein